MPSSDRLPVTFSTFCQAVQPVQVQPVQKKKLSGSAASVNGQPETVGNNDSGSCALIPPLIGDEF